jgi:DNA-binding transcriptional MocR family regulator
VKPVNALLSATGTTVFTVMSALAAQHGSINLGQGFPDTDGPEDVLQAAALALQDGRNQYPPMTGVAELRQAVAAANRRFYGLEIDPDREVVVTSGATEAITMIPICRWCACSARSLAWCVCSRRNGSCRAPSWPRRSGPAPRPFCSTRR